MSVLRTRAQKLPGREQAVPAAPSPLCGDLLLVLWLLAATWAGPETAAGDLHDLHLAYVGPGAGFAFLGSFLSLLAAFLVGAASLLVWPFRVAWRTLKGRQGYKRAKVKKVIFLGLDGLDPDLADRFMGEGRMPNMARLRDEGTYRRLRTTYPPLSPVAWATFSTGVNPGKHNLYDFLNRVMKSYIPELSSSRVNGPSRYWKAGKWKIPLSRPTVDQRRKSRTFWSILGEHQVGSTILRVPITFPPEKFNGRLLSAMCTPDLLGTQGSFLHFTAGAKREEFEGGFRFPLTGSNGTYRGVIEGPENPLLEGSPRIELPFSVEVDRAAKQAVLHIDGQTEVLKAGEYTPWVRMNFRAGPGVKARGISRFMLTQLEPEPSLYLTPINIDPEHPALPISHPSYYAPYLAKLLGEYSTLGLAEDTWALNERVIDERAFLEQSYSICGEREAMFFSSLEKTRRGVVACVFDTSDRVQHMFFRYLEPDHPAHRANPGLESSNGSANGYADVIAGLYERMDALVGRTMQYADEDTVLFVLSDHGFKSFQRGVNLNAWLRENGYLHLKEGATGEEPYLRGIDWSRTRAYTFGLTGIYLNQKGREGQGVVPAEDAAALKQELAEKLTGLRDEEKDSMAIHKAHPKEQVYKGPYVGAAPDVVIGYQPGYRASWDAALGKVSASPVFSDNLKAWSGDHCADPPLIPGVVFCNRKFDAGDPGIEDMAPTALRLFGFEPPAYMDGKDLFAQRTGAPANEPATAPAAAR